MRILLFPGQGSQHPGMGAPWRGKGAVRLLRLAESITGLPLGELLTSGSQEELTRTDVTQPALFAVSMMAMESLEAAGVAYDFAAGHSLGELTALCAAGVYSFEEGLHLVMDRSQLMARAASLQPGAMTAVMGLSAEKFPGILREASTAGPVVLANDNAPHQVVLSGSPEALATAEDLATRAGARRCVRLGVSGAFHSPQMHSAVEGLEKALGEIRFHNARVAVIGNVDAEPETRGEVLKKKLLDQLTRPVQWTRTIRRARALGCTSGLEVGPGKVLSGLGRSIDRSLAVAAINAPGDIDVLKTQEEARSD